MAEALINNTLSSLSSGVTQSFQEGRFDSQVTEMKNCIPTLTRGVIRRNPIKTTAQLEGLPSNISTAFTYSYDRGTTDEQYIVVVPGDGSIFTYNVNDGRLISKTINDPYLQIPLGISAKTSFKAITIGDHTFITNNTVKARMSPVITNSKGYSDMAFYWIKKTTSVVTHQKQTGGDSPDVGSRSEGYTYTLNGKTVLGVTDTRPGLSNPSLNTSYAIAKKFTEIGSGVAYAEQAVAYTANMNGNVWAWSDTFGDEASLGVWKNVIKNTDLPANLPRRIDGFQVRVSGGTSVEFDDYFLKYNYERKAWKEVAAPGAKYKLLGSTMPHVLYRLANGKFLFDEYREVHHRGNSLLGTAWTERTTGGEEAIDDPSFIGQTIDNLFFFKNRIGFLTKNSIILSQTGAYGTFFPQTRQEILDDDTIDLAIASTDVTILRHAVPTSGQLIIFSDDTQFSLTSIDGALTPKSADISVLSNYTYGPKADAVSIGNRVIFSNQVGGYSQLYSYKMTDQGSKLTEADPLTLHLPTYIDKSISRIAGHDVLGYTFFEVEDRPTELIVLNSLSKQGRELQNAFHTWTFEKGITSTHIINNFLYILFQDGDLGVMKLEIPGITADEIYLDSYQGPAAGKTQFKSLLIFSEFFLRGADGKGTVRGRYQLRTMQYTITPTSKYLTTIYNPEHVLAKSVSSMGPDWDDTLIWIDNMHWSEDDNIYKREYENDEKVTVSSNSKKVEITFESSNTDPYRGFELATVNIEALFYQRSKRT